jgi:hypothetical protein
MTTTSSPKLSNMDASPLVLAMFRPKARALRSRVTQAPRQSLFTAFQHIIPAWTCFDIKVWRISLIPASRATPIFEMSVYSQSADLPWYSGTDRSASRTLSAKPLYADLPSKQFPRLENIGSSRVCDSQVRSSSFMELLWSRWWAWYHQLLDTWGCCWRSERNQRWGNHFDESTNPSAIASVIWATCSCSYGSDEESKETSQRWCMSVFCSVSGILFELTSAFSCRC